MNESKITLGFILNGEGKSRGLCNKVFEGIREFLKRIGPSGRRELWSKVPKDSAGVMRWIADSERDLGTFPHAPCPWLCKRNFRRFHFTCLTCWTRRLYFKRRGYEKLRWRKRVYMANKPPFGYRGMIPVQVLTSPTGQPVGLPMYYTNYGIFIPVQRGGRDCLRIFIVKYLLTLVERIAEF